MATAERPPGASIRPIGPGDDAAVAAIIRDVMAEFGACGPGYSSSDAEVDHMSRAYAAPRSAYWVVERAGAVLGGGGIAPLADGDAGTCELRKMFFRPELRGLGMGAALLEQCLDTARAFGYRRCYLETLARMEAARRLYRRMGFTPLERPIGVTGHGRCDAWYVRDL